ncbi:MAG: ChaN family lipoprotein [Pseudomonadota bacterium]
MQITKHCIGVARIGFCAISIAACTEIPTRPADPLAGRIFSTVSQAELSSSELYNRMDNAQVIYLGETHDNTHHHELQKQIIQQLLQRGRRPAIGFEFFSVEQTPYLMQYVQEGPLPKGSGTGKLRETQLRKQLGWTERPDPSWSAYFSLIKIARDNQLPVFGADLPKAMRYRLGRVDVNELTAIERTQLVNTGFEDAAYRQLMFEKFTRAHCGWNDPVVLQRLYDTWLLRNDAMAHSVAVMVKTRGGEPVVMILGSGHVQHDMGVYERVGYLLPDVVQFNLGFKEVARQPMDLGEYIKSSEIEGTGFLPDHEYFWFTQRLSYDDPCHRFRQKLRRKGQ